MLKSRFYGYKMKETGIAVYEAAVHDLSAETADYLVKLLAKRYKTSRRGAVRRLVYSAKWYCDLPFPDTLQGVWERKVDGTARSYAEQADELRP